MLTEFQNVRQHQGEPLRRNFFDDYFDLYVWFDHEERILGIQLCYDDQDHGRALTYLNGKYSHHGIDDGETSPLKNRSPVLVADGAFPKQMIADRFKLESASLPEEIAIYVMDVIGRFPEGKKP